MARTDSATVQSLLQTAGDYDTGNNPSLTRFITAANLLVSRVDTCATNKGYTLTSDELTEMETWLAAFFYQMSDVGYSARSTGGGSGSFKGQWGKHLEANNYGQAALMLDPSGCLAAIGKGQRARILWLGKAPSDQTDYIDRD